MSDNRQTIRRAKHGKENPYFMMARETAQDKSLSYEARGMLSYLLSQPGHWEVRVDDLILPSVGETPTKAGRTKVYSVLNELADSRYIRKPTRYKNDKGRWEWTSYEVYERPYVDLPDMELPDTDEPETELPDILDSTDSENKETESKKTEKEEEKALSAADVFRAYEVNIGTLTPKIMDTVKDWLADVPAEWLIEALDLAVEYNKRSWAYAETILKRWKAQGKDDGKKNAAPTNGAAPLKWEHFTMSPAAEEPDVSRITPEQLQQIKGRQS